MIDERCRECHKLPRIKNYPYYLTWMTANDFVSLSRKAIKMRGKNTKKICNAEIHSTKYIILYIRLHYSFVQDLNSKGWKGWN